MFGKIMVRGLVAAVLLLGSVGKANANAIYDPAAVFEQGWLTHSNPNGVWSYGYSSGPTGAVTLYDTTVQNGVNGPQAQYWLSSAVNIGTSPAVEFNNGPAYANGNINFLANEIVLVAGVGGQYSDLIFTAPASGSYAIAGSFRGDQNGIGTFAGITTQSGVVFGSSVTAEGQIVPFGTTVSLTAGDAVVFFVGPNGGSQNTGLSVTVTPAVPEPSSFALLALGGIGLAFGAYRRCRAVVVC